MIPSVLKLFRQRSLRFDLETTRGPFDAARIARQAVQDHDVIVVLGGDGTVNEVLPGMAFSSRPLGIIPVGSGNDFIKSLHIPDNYEKAFEIILKERTSLIDLGKIQDRYFANAVGIGFDAAVNKASLGINHSKRGLLLYLCALLRTLGRYEPAPVTIGMNGGTRTQHVFLLTAGNGTTVGGGFRLTPDARLDDGLLDVTLVRPIGLAPLLWHLPKVFRGTLGRVTKYVETTRSATVTVEVDGIVPIHIDGEVFERDGNSLVIEAVPKALTVIRGW